MFAAVRLHVVPIVVCTAEVAAMLAAIRVHVVPVTAPVAEVASAVCEVVAQFALVVAQFVNVTGALGILTIQRLTVMPDFPVVGPYFGAFLRYAAPVTAHLGFAQLTLVTMEFPVVPSQFVSGFVNRAVVLTNCGAVVRDLVPVAADFIVDAAEIATAESAVMPAVPEIALIVAGVMGVARTG